MIFVVSGAVLILAGGFASAVGGVSPSPHLSWASAYLVLVCGSAQIALGGGQALFGVRPWPTRVVACEFSAFNLGNAGVLVGTLAGLKVVLDVGSVLFLVALALFAWATRAATSRYRVAPFVYRTALVLLGVSVPIGVLLAH